MNGDGFCPSCGGPLRSAAGFCTFCGNPVGQPSIRSDGLSDGPLSGGRGSGGRIRRALRVPLWAFVAILVLVVGAAVGIYFLTTSTGESAWSSAASVDTTVGPTVGPGTATADELPADAMARVGQTYITKAELDERVQEFAFQYSVASKEDDPEGWAQFERDTLEYLVTYQLALQKSDEYGISVTDEEVQAEIESVITSYYDGDEEVFYEELAATNMTLDQLKLSYKESMLVQKVYDKVTESISAVSDADVLAYYEENKDQYNTDEIRTARHILIAPGTSSANDDWPAASEPTDADWAEALAVAEEVRGKLLGGGDWTELAAQYSDDATTAAAGGDLGEVVKGEIWEEFEEVVFSLEIDEISEPVKTTLGYHIVQVTAITDAQQAFDEVKSEIQITLLAVAKDELWVPWIADTKTELGVVYREGWESTTTTPPAITMDDSTPDSSTASTAPSLAGVPGIDSPLRVGEVDLQVTSAMFQGSFSIAGSTYSPDSGGDRLLVVGADVDGLDESTFGGWEGQVTLTDESGRVDTPGMTGSHQRGPSDPEGPGELYWIQWIFSVSSESHSFTLNLPGGLSVDLSSVLLQ